MVYRRVCATSVIAATIVAASLVTGPAAGAASADVTDVVAGLTDSQRESFTSAGDLDVPDVYVDEAIDTASSEPVEVIVELKDKPADTAVAIAEAQGRDLSKAAAQREVKDSQQRFVRFLRDLPAATAPSGAATGARPTVRAEADADDETDSDVQTGSDADDQADAAPLAEPAIEATYSEAINGYAIELPADQVPALRESPDVAAVWTNETFRLDLPKTVPSAIGTAAGDDEVALLHGEGVTGAGVKVGVLDTGIDYTHPALADRYRGGYDLVDDDDDPMETTYADWQASGRSRTNQFGDTYYTQHGTHVAGIIAGTDERGTWGAAGVAPEADIYAYRVLGPYGSGSTEDILAGMERAVADGMDVVNMSLGGNLNDPRHPLSVAADNMTLAGVTTVLAAGNSGAAGAFSLGSPAASALAITVGANDFPIEVSTLRGQVGETGVELRLLARPVADTIAELDGTSLPIVSAGLGRATDYRYFDGTRWQDVPADGAAVLIQRGGISLDEKIARAKSKGAAAVVVVNTTADEGHIPYYLGESDAHLPSFSVTTAEGGALSELVTAGGAEIAFADFAVTTTDGGYLADFSSRGPAKGTSDIKPEITAPGVSVLSSIPAYMVDPDSPDDHATAYARLSGTSMAAPYVAGVAALLVESQPDLDPITVKSALMNSADPLADDYSVFEIGAGQVDAYQAVHTTATITTHEPGRASDSRREIRGRGHWTRPTGADAASVSADLSFGLFAAGDEVRERRQVQITNHTDRGTWFTVRSMLDDGAGTQDLVDNGATLRADRKVFVPAGKTGNVNVTLDVPADAAEGTYGGYVEVVQDGVADPRAEAFRVPFGFRIVTKGIDELLMVKPVMTTNTTDVIDPQLIWGVSVLSHTRTIDVFLTDSDGNDVGYLGAIDAVAMAEGPLYGAFGWGGSYFPLTGDKDFPISHRSRLIEPGHHVLTLVGTDDSGDTYAKSADFYVDNTAPTFTSNHGGKDFGELPASDSTYEYTGTLIDGEVADMQAAGLDVDQSDSQVFLYSFSTNRPSDRFYPEENGDFSYTADLGPSPVTTHRYAAVDAAGNIGGRDQLFLMDEGHPIIVGTDDVPAVAPDEIVTSTYTGHHLEAAGQVRVSVTYDARDTEIVDVRKSPALAAISSADLDISYAVPSANLERADITITVDEGAALPADPIDLLEVEYRALGTRYVGSIGALNVGVTVFDVDGEFTQAWRVFDVPEYLSPSSSLTGYFLAQGMFLPGDYFDPDRDHAAAGPTVEITAPDGTVYTPEVRPDASFDLAELPLAEEPYHLVATLPGHLAQHAEITAADIRHGRLAGRPLYHEVHAYGGDVNGDDVVDILDAVAVHDAKGTSDRAADINFDGVVDRTDLAFVERNYLMRNPTVDDVPTPSQKWRGQTLDDIVASFEG